MDRNLDGIYFRVQRDEKWGNACFSDLTQEEMERVMEKLKSLVDLSGYLLNQRDSFLYMLQFATRRLGVME